MMIDLSVHFNKHNVMNGERGSRETPSLFLFVVRVFSKKFR